jgi:Sec7-like guanine-nucleotide exchange factor
MTIAQAVNSRKWLSPSFWYNSIIENILPVLVFLIIYNKGKRFLLILKVVLIISKLSA